MKETIARVGDRVNKDGLESICLIPEEIVRCKDCKLRYTNKCVLFDQAFPINKQDDWFCADVEK